ncbi:MAG: di-heme-cytochrome C peroxidase, partial [Mariprofundaceae bacterium]
MRNNTKHPIFHGLKTFFCFLKSTGKWALLLFTLFALALFVKLTVSDFYEFQDDAENRGAVAVANDEFGDHVTQIKYLEQNWEPEESLWFYTVTQGSNLMPYDFFLVLEQEKNKKLFRDNSNISHYRYLPQEKSDNNPDGLPVGMVKDSYQDREYMGYTCAACHTSQVNYNGIGMRIDGGPSAADMETFMVDLSKAMQITLNGAEKIATPESKAKLDRFVKAVLEKDNYADRQEILVDLEKFTQRVKTYTVINRPGNFQRPKTTYGYARLDAFGRIFNRVLEHIMSAKQMRALLKKHLTQAELDEVMKDAEPILSGDDRDHIISRLQKILQDKGNAFHSAKIILKLRDAIYNPPDAPVSYPFLWDIPQHDYVQWNGIVANAGVGPIGRNAGQVIGVFGTLDWQEQDHWDISTLLGGQGSAGPWVNFKSSLNVRNLRRVETQLSKLQSPQWPEDILGKINRDNSIRDKPSASRGKPIFNKYCASCHAEINRSDPKRRVVAQMTRVSSVGTDP